MLSFKDSLTEVMKIANLIENQIQNLIENKILISATNSSETSCNAPGFKIHWFPFVIYDIKK